jgi:ABC-type polar amino acid transport system ATPase subunit
LPRDEADSLALNLLDRVGLSRKAHRYPRHLSGGEKQRVAIARALAMSSDILLLDEPTSALDPLMTAEVLQSIQELSHQGITLVVVTHEVQFACHLADRILFLNEGRIEIDGPPATYLEGLQHPIAKRYFHHQS